MTFNFDEEILRTDTHCVKWEFIVDGDDFSHGDHAHPKHGSNRLLPMWVADMDFRAPPAVIEALVARAEHGLFGYTSPTDCYFESVINWFSRRYGRAIERDWIVMTPGVVPALYALVETFVQPGEKVLVQRPVYYPFFSAIESNDAEIVSNTLAYVDGRYEMDFEELAVKTADPDVKMAILCSPHNPVGRVWTPQELMRFGEICFENDVLVVSDEIHGDLILSDNSFTSFASISDEFAQRSIVCTAGSKTFNLAGLKTSNIIIPDQTLRESFSQTLLNRAIYGAGAFGIVALEAAYDHGEPWLEAVLDYIEDNYRFMVSYLAEHLPQLKVIPLEGTYLVWVDFGALALSPVDRRKLLMEGAKIYLDEGQLFGPEGEKFERFNIACPRSILVEALERIRNVIDELPS